MRPDVALRDKDGTCGGTSRQEAGDGVADLVAFLRARLDEDEAAAMAATPGSWRYDPKKEWRNPERPFTDGQEAVFAGPPDGAAITICSTGPSNDPPSMADARHIARWDPARVLAEVAAKQQLIEAFSTAITVRDGAIARVQTGSVMRADFDDIIRDWAIRVMTLEPLVVMAAQPYADHPNFDPAWKVS